MKTRFALVTIFVVASAVQPLRAIAQDLASADCINCNSTPTAGIQWTGTTTDVGWPYVASSSFELAEIATNFGGGLGANRTITAEIFQGIPGQPGAKLLGSVSFFSTAAHGQLGGAPFPSPIPLTQGQQYFIGFLNVGGLGLNVDADNDFMGSFSDPDDTPDTCDGRIPPDPTCDPDGAALRLLGDATLGGLHIDTDGSGTFANIDFDLAPVALDAPIVDLRAAAAVATPSPVECVGDCDAGGQVTVNEIIALVNIALGNAQPSACPNGIPSGSAVNVALIITAVNNALNGCTPSGMATPTPTPTEVSPTPGSALQVGAAVAGRTTIAIDTVRGISDVIAALANGFSLGAAVAPSAFSAASAPGGHAAGSCPLAGTATTSGNPITGETVTLTGCAAPTVDGSVTFDGSITLGLLTGLTVDVQLTLKDLGGTVTRTATANFSGSALPVLGGSCYLTGATLTLTGSLSTTIPGGSTVGINFGGTTVTVDNITFNASCVPTVYDVTLDGPGALLDPDGTPQAVTFNDLVIHVDASGSSTLISVNGGMESPCFGGAVTLTTQTLLTAPSGEPCPVAGVITVTAAGGAAQITFQSDGSVVVQSGASGTVTAPNCLDPRLLMCAA